MALTPPADGTATYNAPVEVHWFAYDLFASALMFPADMADVLTDDDLAAIMAVIDSALTTKYPTLRVSRYTSWSVGAANTFDSVTVQEAEI